MDIEEAEKIVDSLSEGSAEIDRMKFVINRVMGVVLGSTSLLIHERNRVETLNVASTYRWRLVGRKDESGVEAIEFVRIHKDSSLSPTRIYSSAIGSSGISKEHVAMVYMSLAHLIRWLILVFPNIKKEWRPFLDAADMAGK